MRDFRDAKAMAYALRDALNANAIEITHSECLELIAKAFGYENWNILSAKINATRPCKPAASTLATTEAEDPEVRKKPYCSFCGKSQHEVQALVAGPHVFICDECIDLCDDILDHQDDQDILSLLEADMASGNQAYPSVFERLSQMSTEEVASYVARCRKAAERHRLGLQYIQQNLATRRSDQPETAQSLSSPRIANLQTETDENLRTRLAEGERGLKRYEDAIRIGVAVLGTCGQPR